jgi:peptidoglycan/xylan/chitin deacetylase (PgdA/CDA1 family)
MMMRFRGRKLVARALRPLSRALFPGAVVIGYHRVAETAWDPLGLAVAPDCFAAQLEALKARREVVSLRELAARHAAGEGLERYAALTFDDGYRDFAETVLPAVEAFGVPATVFVATGVTGGSFWWDEVAALLAPEHAAAPTLEIARNSAAPWRYGDLDRPERRAAAALELCAKLVCGDEHDIGAVIGQLRAWAGAQAQSPPDGGPLGRTQIEALARHPLVEIGAHTVSHGCLGRVAPEAQRAEIVQSKAELESVTGAAVTVFSYPNGSYSAETPGLVKALGFACACTSEERAFGRRSDPYLIPRIWAPNAGGASFDGWLGRWVASKR